MQDSMPGMNHARHGADHSQHGHPKQERPAVPRVPAILSKTTKTLGIDEAYRMLAGGGDTLDAALHICKAEEDDPQDHSAGLGGLPNMAGEVQLDACCLHGPTRRAAAVASVSGICNASLLARALMDRTGNALLVGSDAQAFAREQGMAVEDLLTDRTRANYKLWKRLQADPSLLGHGGYDPSWPEPHSVAHFLPDSQAAFDTLITKLEPLAVEAGIEPALTWRAVFDAVAPAAEPVYVAAIGAKGQLSSASTSSGRPWRMPGIASDVAVLGAGCFLDPEVGSAGASGSAEANLRIAGAHTIVENMRMGMSPEDAGMDALKRIAKAYNNDMAALRFVEIVYYILRKDGAYAGVSLWRGDRAGHVRDYTVIDGDQMRRAEECRFLFDNAPLNGLARAH